MDYLNKNEYLKMDGRVRLRQWLEGRLNTGFIPGLIWIDKSKGIFKIPWKHHSKHTWQEDDAAIFKDWAVVTGRYHEGFDVPDWPMWKTRLRCALNKAPDIQEVRQHHNLHCDEPFKVYRFISKTESMWRANASKHASLIFDGLNTKTSYIAGSSNTDITQFFPGNNSQTLIRKLSPISHSNKRTSSLSKPITLIQKTEQGNIKLKYINIPVHITNSSLSTRKLSFLNSSLHRTTLSANISSPGNISTLPAPSFTTALKSSTFKSPLISSTIIDDDKSLSFSTESISSIDLPSFKLSDIMEPEVHQVCLRIQHLEHRVSDMIVNNPNGFCIYFGRFDENLTSAGPEPIEPQIYQYVSESNKYCVDMLLDNMQRGVVLSILDGCIYAEKLCKCATFVYRPGNNGEFYFVDKLNRRDKMMIFDYRSFLEELHYFQRGLGEKPHVELILAFGQQIKENSSPESLYVWCRLASCKAWFLLQKALMNESKSISKNIRQHTAVGYKSDNIDHGLIDFSETFTSISDVANIDFDVKQEEELGSEELIEEENVVDHLVYGANCLSDELELGVVVSMDNEDFSSMNFHSRSSRSDDCDLTYQFEHCTSNYDFK